MAGTGATILCFREYRSVVGWCPYIDSLLSFIRKLKYLQCSKNYD